MGLTLDTGALIAFERRDRGLMAHLKEAERRGETLTVPTVVLAEAWRGGPRAARIARLLEACTIEPLLEDLARLAGESLKGIEALGAVDAVVVASAAGRRDRILTSDPKDLRRLGARFPQVRIVAISSRVVARRP